MSKEFNIKDYVNFMSFKDFDKSMAKINQAIYSGEYDDMEKILEIVLEEANKIEEASHVFLNKALKAYGKYIQVKVSYRFKDD